MHTLPTSERLENCMKKREISSEARKFFFNLFLFNCCFFIYYIENNTWAGVDVED